MTVLRPIHVDTIKPKPSTNQTLQPTSTSGNTPAGSGDGAFPKGLGFFSPPGSTNGSDSNTGSGFGGFGSAKPSGSLPGTTGSGRGTSMFGSLVSNKTDFGAQASTGTGGSPSSFGGGFGSAAPAPAPSGSLANGQKVRVNLPKGTETSPGQSKNPFPPSTKNISW